MMILRSGSKGKEIGGSKMFETKIMCFLQSSTRGF